MRISYTRSRLSRMRHPSFRTKLLVSYMILIIVPLGIMGYKYYWASMDFVSEFARQNIHSIVKQNNEMIDAELSRITDSSLAMIADQDLFKEFLNARQGDEYRMITMEKNIRRIESKYFSEFNNIYSVHLITGYANFGSSQVIPYAAFKSTQLYREAMRMDGGLSWIPSYDFADMFHSDYLKSASIDYRYLFSAVRLLKLFQLDGNDMTPLEGRAELPVLVVNYQPDLYLDVFENSLPVKGASFFVTSKEGDIIAHSDKNKIAARETPEWLDDMARRGSGSLVISSGGKPMIVCFDTSRVTGWISGIVISPEELMSSFIPTIRSYTFYLAVILVAASLLFAFLFAESITKPVKKLLQAIKKAGEGDFETKIPINNKSEMGYLISKFNQMSAKIKILIEENYKVAIREKEAEIMALNIQLNPHFLYNTLNVINWMALENKQKEISRMLISLSSMLQYTSQNQHDIGEFGADLEWLRNYIYIIDNRFEGKFTVAFEIEPELYKYKVPKLFLQPFVENAIIHGFSGIESGGEIRIRGWIEDGDRYFAVEDNGRGISSGKLREIAASGQDSIGIQNVNKRIKLIYGDGYGVRIDSLEGQGTIVIITLPGTNL
ncbi:sensor histidine kinase [Paenibacillus sp. sptzw28]|uniref:sensor histidine kinase n=1 Tax=Paenibacillus sp. sptzw28 TaxID=715179 RepID=UPI001C6E5F40|nr:sensor histidine kinase [Paenibacillus sp. sptzw28]QYR19497.1 sensor histidine kinase [Paenibacillus sp. sptzw28]